MSQRKNAQINRINHTQLADPLWMKNHVTSHGPSGSNGDSTHGLSRAPGPRTLLRFTVLRLNLLDLGRRGVGDALVFVLGMYALFAWK